jgi:predicted GNAT superfamily acetyltransferase
MTPDPAVAARAAAARAGVSVRALHSHEDLTGARGIWDLTWPSVAEGTQVTPNLLRAVEHSGGYVAGAFDEGRMVGAALALVGRHRGGGGWHDHLHSHMAAAVPGRSDRGIGTALKLHQRSWALEQDIATIEWTFDPLVRRNARLNLVKLGAVGVQYLPDFYGDMPDEVNHGDPSDRLLVRWELDSRRVDDAVDGRTATASREHLLAAGAVRGLAAGRNGVPAPTGESGRVTLVTAPGDIVALRRGDPEAASTWRLAVRVVLAPLVDAGAAVTGLTVEGDYVVEAR